ncbi:helix-turn-helix domain-containing protein [Streptomyces sp. NPDC057854]|uniref:helix-turn-helix domain-containing protein n=1 Tax=Streptomyces sp. NPDC057854 TaxID=3346264 RepID=UPI0036C5FD59
MGNLATPARRRLPRARPRPPPRQPQPALRPGTGRGVPGRQTDAALPENEHPDDLLSAGEVAEILGISTGTVRTYATSGHFSPGITIHGSRLWPRHEIHDRLHNAPGRGTGGGRRPGEPQGPRKTHPYAGDPRLHTARQALNTAPAGTPKGRLATELAATHGHTPRTWERLLTTAAEHPHNN